MKKAGVSGNDTTFWAVLLTAAYRNGYTATAICDKLGLSRTYISKGKTTKTVPLIDTAARLLHACGFGLYAIPFEDAPKGALEICAGDHEGDNNT